MRIKHSTSSEASEFGGNLFGIPLGSLSDPEGPSVLRMLWSLKPRYFTAAVVFHYDIVRTECLRPISIAEAKSHGTLQLM